jgi:prephenate dehydrogenase
MWAAIAHENASAIDIALAAAERVIAEFRRALVEQNRRELHERFSAAREWFQA